MVENADRQLPLLGCDWLYKLRLNWPNLLAHHSKEDPRVHTLHTAAWINEYQEVTKEGLGKLKGIQAEVELKVGAKSQLDQYHLHCEKRWKKHCGNKSKIVDRSDWASLFIVVKKKDGGIQICADFKRTIKPHLQ